MRKGKVDDVDNWLYRIEMLQRNKNRKRNYHSKDFRRMKNDKKYYG
ncbi:MAG: hypothetical protein KAJ44_05175 [Thermoplasmatales archaeon]|nr:hypothetical protein [Thermoplasmatales archaeon]